MQLNSMCQFNVVTLHDSAEFSADFSKHECRIRLQEIESGARLSPEMSLHNT